MGGVVGSIPTRSTNVSLLTRTACPLPQSCDSKASGVMGVQPCLDCFIFALRMAVVLFRTQGGASWQTFVLRTPDSAPNETEPQLGRPDYVPGGRSLTLLPGKK